MRRTNMKRIFPAAAALLLLFSCAQPVEETAFPAAAPETIAETLPETDAGAGEEDGETVKLKPMQTGELPRIIRDEKTGGEVSAATLILSLDPEAEDGAVERVLEAYGLEVLYRYRNFGLMAVKLPAPLTSEALDELIVRLEEEPGILGAMKDGVAGLDGAAMTGGLD